MADKLHDIYAALAASERAEPEQRLAAICDLCIRALTVTGAGIMLMADRAHQGTLYATDDRIRMLEELQNAAGEGPCLDSYNLGRPVWAPDLEATGPTAWPTLAPGALKEGMRALFSLPLQLDDASFGALNLYRE